MAMQMQRAFNAKMLTKMVRYSTGADSGYYDDNNFWVQSKYIKTNIRGVLTSGNKFSQFTKGQALHSEDGGQRFSDYRTLYVTDKYTVELEDKIGFDGAYFNVLQRSDYAVNGYFEVQLEKSKEWTP